MVQDLKTYGIYNTVTTVDPYDCRFLAGYPDGRMIRGKNFIDTGWDDIPQGLAALRYSLSTGHIITILKFRAYLPLIEVSLGIDGSKMFHSINVKCLADKEVLVYSIILKQTPDSKLKIGDVVISKEGLPTEFGKSWKYTDRGFSWR